MEENIVLVKYFSDHKQVLEGIFKDHKIRFTQPWGMNDPLEFNPILRFTNQEFIYQSYDLKGVHLPSMELFYRVQIIESQINAYGILSLSTQPRSFDMWSRYANGHKGFVLAFKPNFVSDPCMQSRDGRQIILRKVDYVDNYVLDFGSLANESGEIPFEVLQDKYFFTKTSRWKDEHEYRLVRPLTDCPEYKQLTNHSYRDENVYLFDFSLDCIDSVIFGACMSVEYKRAIMNHCKGREIQFWQEVIIRDRFDENNKPGSVSIFRIADYLDTSDQIYTIKPQQFCIDQAQNKDFEKIEINELNDLPYYEDYKEIVDGLFGDLKNSPRE